jgi:protein gp37
MGEVTKIEWAHHTFNGVRGCAHADLEGESSPGCNNCYAETMSHRNPGILGQWGEEGTRVLAKPAYWKNLDKSA